MKILFIGKKDDSQAELAATYTQELFPNTLVVWSRRDIKIPSELKAWEGDYIFSYLAQWIIPGWLLAKASLGGVNWHPGPPTYPGIGCTNFAVYDRAEIFGITCHYMKPRVDTGRIIEVAEFSVTASDTVFSLTQKCHEYILTSYQRQLKTISEGSPLPDAGVHWKRKPYTRKELDALCVISPDMDIDEIQRRVKATKYDRHWAYVELGGVRFRATD
jgi:methionyl-tRNA formyltransferase